MDADVARDAFVPAGEEQWIAGSNSSHLRRAPQAQHPGSGVSACQGWIEGNDFPSTIAEKLRDFLGSGKFEEGRGGGWFG